MSKFEQLICNLSTDNAEKGLIGHLLFNNDDIARCISENIINDFSIPQNKEAMQNLYDIYKKFNNVDIISMVETSKHNHNYIQTCIELSRADSIIYFLNIIKITSIKRQAISKAREVMNFVATNKLPMSSIELNNKITSMMKIDMSNQSEEKTLSDMCIEAITDIETQYNNRKKGLDSNKKYGFRKIDHITNGIRAGELNFLAGRPGTGKTALAIQFMINLAKKDNNIVFFSLEMTRIELLKRMFSNLSKIEYGNIQKGDLQDSDWICLTESMQEIIDYSKIDIIDTPRMTVEHIRNNLLKLSMNKKMDMVIVDYIQRVSPSIPAHKNNKVEFLEYTSNELKEIAKEFNCNVLCLAQLNRENSKEGKRPALHHLKGSGSMEQDADGVFFLYNPSANEYQIEGEDKIIEKDYRDIEFIIAKQRAGMSDIGTNIRFLTNIQKFVDIGEEQ